MKIHVFLEEYKKIEVGNPGKIKKHHRNLRLELVLWWQYSHIESFRLRESKNMLRKPEAGFPGKIMDSDYEPRKFFYFLIMQMCVHTFIGKKVRIGTFLKISFVKFFFQYSKLSCKKVIRLKK